MAKQDETFKNSLTQHYTIQQATYNLQFSALLNITSCFGGMGSVKKYTY